MKKVDHDILTLIKIRVEKIAKAKGISMAQLSLAWIMSQKGKIFPCVILHKSNGKHSNYKAYPHPLLELPLLKTYMISLVWC